MDKSIYDLYHGRGCGCRCSFGGWIFCSKAKVWIGGLGKMILTSFSQFRVCSASLHTLFYKNFCEYKEFARADGINNRKVSYGKKEDEVRKVAY